MRPTWIVVLLLACLPALLGAATPPQDPLVGQQPHLQVVGAFDAWEVRRGEGAIVAVLDTGVDLDHPDLDGRLLEGIDLIEPGTPPDDPQGHGTIVAGIIAAVANNNRGVAGVAPRAMILPIRVLDADGRGTADTVADGIRFAIDQGVDVINLSLAEVRPEDEDDQGSGDQGQSLGSTVAPPSLDELSVVESEDVVAAIEEADAAGILVVAAAGNDGRDRTPYDDDTPALVVGATDEQGYVWESSNRDERTLFAPGVRILSTWHEGRYARSNGTSFATPIVAAGAALLMGAGIEADEAVERLTSTAIAVGDPPPPDPQASPSPTSQATPPEPQPSPTAPAPPPPPPVEPGEEVGLGRVDLAAAIQGVEPAPTPTETPPPPPADEPEPQIAEPASPAPGGGGIETVQTAQPTAPATTPPAVVTEAPPPVQAGPPPTNPLIPANPADQVVADLEPAEPVDESDGADQAGLQVAGDPDPDGDARQPMTVIATALVGANLLGAVFVLRRRPEGLRTPSSG